MATWRERVNAARSAFLSDLQACQDWFDGAQAEGGDGQRRVGRRRGREDGGAQDKEVGVVMGAQVPVDHGGSGVVAHTRGSDDVARTMEIGRVLNLRRAEPCKDLLAGLSGSREAAAGIVI